MILSVSLYEWLLFVHVLAAMVWLGGAAMTAALALRALRSDDDGEIARFVGSLRVVGPFVLAPPPALLLGAGLWSWGVGLILLLLVVATWDMVVKPGL
jgi:hypothetical protein